MIFDPDALPLIVIGLAFLAGGIVKGVIGIGLPLIVVPVLATFAGPVVAIALMLVPALSSNVMQAYQAGFRLSALKRFWMAVVGIMAGAILGSTFLSGADTETATAALGVVVLVFCATQLLATLPPVSAKAEGWFTPLAGTASGFAGGLTGFFGLALVPYLLSLRLTKEEFVATIAMLYLFGVSALYINLYAEQVFTWTMVVISALGSVPTLAGVWIGSRLRKRVAEKTFRRLLIMVLLAIAANLLRKSFTG